MDSVCHIKSNRKNIQHYFSLGLVIYYIIHCSSLCSSKKYSQFFFRYSCIFFIPYIEPFCTSSQPLVESRRIQSGWLPCSTNIVYFPSNMMVVFFLLLCFSANFNLEKKCYNRKYNGGDWYILNWQKLENCSVHTCEIEKL